MSNYILELRVELKNTMDGKCYRIDKYEIPENYIIYLPAKAHSPVKNLPQLTVVDKNVTKEVMSNGYDKFWFGPDIRNMAFDYNKITLRNDWKLILNRYNIKPLSSFLKNKGNELYYL